MSEQAQPYRTKYHNKKAARGSLTFDSQAEARRYDELRLLEQAGVIEHLECQPKFHLLDTVRYHGKTYRAVSYYADFRYKDKATGAVIVEDVKGMMTQTFKLKLHLLLEKYPYIDFRIVKA
jgi:hypothetical protein